MLPLVQSLIDVVCSIDVSLFYTKVESATPSRQLRSPQPAPHPPSGLRRVVNVRNLYSEISVYLLKRLIFIKQIQI